MPRISFLNSVTAAVVLCIAAAARSETLTTLRTDFQGGMPATFTQVDGDGNTPSVDMASFGFAPGTAWLTLEEENGDGNIVAASTSWYTPAGRSDDRLITPAVAISADTHLRFRARAYDARFADGYVLLVAEDGTDTWQELMSVPAEKAQWQSYDLPLAQYAGKSVRVAFVNNSYNCSRLYLDDVYVGAPVRLQADADMPRIVTPGDIIIRARATNLSDAPVNGFTATYTDGARSAEQHFDIVIAAGESVDFAFADPLRMDNNSTLTLTIGVTVDGMLSQDQAMVSAIHRAVLLEEGTGTWCGWCVRGIVYLERYAEHFGSHVVPIAVHGGGGYDPMRAEDYTTSLDKIGGGGYPYMVIDRSYSVDPSAGEQTIAGLLAKPAEFGLGLTMHTDAERGTIDVAADVYPVYDSTAALALTFAIVEEEVYMPDNPEYRQHNSYWDGNAGDMGGFESLPEYVPAEQMHYRHVARAITDFDGIPGSLPERYTARVPEQYTATLQIPETVINPAQLSVVAILLDTRTRRVVNVASAGAKSTSIDTLPQTALPTGIYDLQGRRVANPTHGIYILVSTDGVRKVVL